MKNYILIGVLSMLFSACGSQDTPTENTENESTLPEMGEVRNHIYKSVKLTTDVSKLSKNQKEMIKLLMQAADVMDELFWEQSYGYKNDLLSKITDEETRKFVEVNYGPWDRLAGNVPFIEGVGAKPKGANFYPADMTVEEYEAFNRPEKDWQYTLIRRDEKGQLMVVPYGEAYHEKLAQAAELMLQASELSENFSFSEYLRIRADGLMADDFDHSDHLWLDMRGNDIDFIVGPIENYEDQLFGTKAAYEAYLLVKDKEWSQRLEKYTAYLPQLQQELPVPDEYKKELPGNSSQLNAYDVIYYAGDCNSGSKTIAVNLPNSELIQMDKGTRRSQLKNAMKAKFDHILVPISEVLIDESQREYITFEAFFSNTMFHEVAHGLGIKNTIDGQQTVKEALKEQHSALEEGKADVLGLHMITSLESKKELEGDLKEYYVTFLASIFRSVRFGASSAHGKANMLRFNYFQEMGAFQRDEKTGTYKVNFSKMKKAVKALSGDILKLQGDGDYDGVVQLMKEKGSIGEQLQKDLDLLEQKNIPIDVVFEQGPDVLGI